ncbi:hypothetical protein R6Q59_014565 [Mikania micrantha]
MNLLVDGHDDGDNVNQMKRFWFVYTRKGKRTVLIDLTLKVNSFDENHGSDKMYEKKKNRISLELVFDGICVLKKGPIVFAASCSCRNGVKAVAFIDFQVL